MTAPTPPAAMSEAREREIRGRLAKATPGPWSHDDDGEVDRIKHGRPSSTIATLSQTHLYGRRPRPDVRANATLIAHAPEDLATLLAEVARLQRDRDHWREANRNSLAAGDMLVEENARLRAASSSEQPTCWTCWHCGETYVDPAEAAAHFGERDDPPACVTEIARLRGEVERLRTALRELLGQWEIAAVMPEATGKALVLRMDDPALGGRGYVSQLISCEKASVIGYTFPSTLAA